MAKNLGDHDLLRLDDRRISSFSIVSDQFENEPNFGLCFDIDGVLAHGTQPLDEAISAFKLMSDDDGKLKVPCCFVTNAAGCPKAKADTIADWFKIKVDASQVILAPTPLTVFRKWHDKRVLVIGQGDVISMAQNLGFKNILLIEDVCKAFPALDYVDHNVRNNLRPDFKNDPNFKRVEALVFLGEPIAWERSLQICIDLITSNGLPEQDDETEQLEDKDFAQLPILACNMDLQFKAKAKSPRFGHGAFLLCLEQLYERICARKLYYSAIIGKPSEITYRYAEHMLNKTSQALGYKTPISKIYFFGDNPEVDILGANLYNNFLSRNRRINNRRFSQEELGRIFKASNSITTSRNIPEDELFPQTARVMYSILVYTGVYMPDVRKGKHHEFSLRCHRDFQGASDLVLPTYEASTVLDGVIHVLRDNSFDFSMPCQPIID